MILDLFAGPGGWSQAARTLGEAEVGLERDAAVCRTRARAGHLTVRGDVAAYPTAPFHVSGLIASPPCPTFSAAGNRDGVADLPALLDFATAVGIIGWRDPPAFGDRRTALVLEPLRWVDALRPAWVALEQVPPVLPLWERYASVWRILGYRCWTGILNAADFGVPQTRRRAFLLASRTRPVQPPEPTHCRGGGDTLFGTLAPWVSMADALGWGMTAAPYPVIACSSPTGGPDKEKVGGSGARAFLYGQRDSGQWVVNTGRDRKEGGSRADAQTFDPADQPAPTVTGNSNGQWWIDRPATTIQGDPRVFTPGGHFANDGRDNSRMKGRSDDAIRVTLADALVLQSFPADYPVQGSRSKQFEQVGNAMPVRLAVHVLAAVMGVPVPEL